MDRTNARQLQKLPEPPELVTIDVSFISLDFILPAVKMWFEGRAGDIIALVKPQFEAGKEEVQRHKGVIRDKEIHARVLEHVMRQAQALGFQTAGLIASPITGSDGNTEFLLWLCLGRDEENIAIQDAIARVIPPETD
jgi:Predicted rRNA methylase